MTVRSSGYEANKCGCFVAGKWCLRMCHGDNKAKVHALWDGVY